MFHSRGDRDLGVAFQTHPEIFCKESPAMWETWVQSLGWEDPLEEGMATHTSILAWRIPWTEEPGGLQSMGPQMSQTRLKQLSTAQHCEVGRHLFGLSSPDGYFLETTEWPKGWQPTPVFLPGEFHGHRSLTSYSPWCCRESNMTERLTLSLFHCLYCRNLL